ncbi:MAG: sugar phosphate isomerase/epimerase [Planctomycetes bacterium]|nr:sugar phosphate isomerase/epimerase [Planctomycetota bacterium]
MSAIDRRRVLSLSTLALSTGASIGALASALGACRSATAQAATAVRRTGGRRKLKKALGIGMIGAGETLMDKFKLARDCGFAGIEMDGPSSHRHEDVLAARDASGLAIPSVVDSVHWAHSLGDPDAAVRAQGRAGLEGALRDAHAYGAKSVLLVPAVVDKNRPYDAAWTHSIAEIRATVPLARELGVQIAVENVWNNFVLSPMEANRYLDEIGSDWVGWHLDLGNLLIYGWPEQWTRILGARVFQLHIKEFSRKKMDEEGRWDGFGVELGEGDNDWPAIMRALDDIAYDGWAIAEVGGGDEARLRDVSARMDRCFVG